MERHCFRYVVVLLAIVISVDILTLTAGGRELRPSDHGLAYQDSSKPAKKQDVRDMLSFFGRTPPPPLELPEGKNVTATWWSDGGGVTVEDSRDGEKHRMVKEVLLVASLVCGVTGAALLAAAAFLVASRRRDRRRETSVSMPTLATNVVVHK